MRDINQFIKSILYFVPFSILLYVIFIIFIGSNIPFQFLKPNLNYRKGSSGFMYSRIKEIKDYKNIDILFLGSSHAYRGFDIRIFKKHGLECFNLGSSNQSPIQTDVLLQRHLETLNPKIVIFDVNPEIFSLDGVESSLDLIANDKNDILTIKKLIKKDNIKTINTAILAFYRDFFNIDKNFTEHRKKEDDTYISGGFVEKELKFYNPTQIDSLNLNLNKNQIAAFNRCIKRIQSKNIKLILVQSPVTKPIYKSYTATEKFENLILKYGENYNFNELLNLNDSTHFYDSHHLNQNGVNVFNQELINLLNSEWIEILNKNKVRPQNLGHK